MKETILISCMLLAAPIAMAQDTFTPITISANTQSATPVATPTAEETIGNGNIQNAISYKNERKALKKQVSITEKRLKSLDRAKEKMRKNVI